jgi:hypothetical protein
VSCSEITAAPLDPRRDLTPSLIEEDCGGYAADENGCTGSIITSPVGAPPISGTSWGDAIYQAPGDPSPGAYGIWLGPNVVPNGCFRDLNPGLADADLDWLADHCELELARAFAPGLQLSDNCGDGEPHWAAKYFNSRGIVRLAFMPAYYLDCGYAGHIGDAELIVVEVTFNYSTQHWEFRRMWLSAHHDAAFYGLQWGQDRSQWVERSGTRFGGGNQFFTPPRYLGHPIVAVATGKHANYSSPSKCENAVQNIVGIYADSCYNGPSFRFPIVPSRNVGSRFVDHVGCTVSTRRSEGLYVGCEAFYQWKRFFGWQVIPYALQGNTYYAGSTPYSELLNSDKFELLSAWDIYDWGPGPHAPGYVPPDGGGGGGGCANPIQIICEPW